MPSRSFAFVLLLVTAPALAMACGGKIDGGGNDGGPGSSSSSGSGSGGSTISCATTDMSECITIPANVGASCPAPSTTSVSSCPSSNNLGCCSITATASSGQMVTVATCYYCAGPFNGSVTSASTFSMACAAAGSSAMWTAGDVASCGDGG